MEAWEGWDQAKHICNLAQGHGPCIPPPLFMGDESKNGMLYPQIILWEGGGFMLEPKVPLLLLHLRLVDHF